VGVSIAVIDVEGFTTLTVSVPFVLPAGIVSEGHVTPGNDDPQLTVTAPEKPPLGVTVMVELPVDIVPDAPEVVVTIVAAAVIARPAVTVNGSPLLAVPPTVTMTLPVRAAAGTGAVIAVALQAVGVAAVPLNVTVLVLCVAPKFAPVIVTDVPTRPEVGFRLVIDGGGTFTVKFTVFEGPPPGGPGFETVTGIIPAAVMSEAGTVTTS